MTAYKRFDRLLLALKVEGGYSQGMQAVSWSRKGKKMTLFSPLRPVSNFWPPEMCVKPLRLWYVLQQKRNRNWKLRHPPSFSAHLEYRCCVTFIGQVMDMRTHVVKRRAQAHGSRAGPKLGSVYLLSLCQGCSLPSFLWWDTGQRGTHATPGQRAQGAERTRPGVSLLNDGQNFDRDGEARRGQEMQHGSASGWSNSRHIGERPVCLMW